MDQKAWCRGTLGECIPKMLLGATELIDYEVKLSSAKTVDMCLISQKWISGVV